MKFDRHFEGRELARRAARTDVAFDVLVRCAAGEFQAQIVNLSARGFRIKSNKALEPGWEITLAAGKLAPVRGIVRWVTGPEAGGAFTDPIIL
jgi:PilZ domain